MTRIVLRTSALADLEILATYFDTIDPDITIRIVADIQGSIDRLRDFPSSGQAIENTPLRRVTSRRYRFTVSYFVAPDRVEIVGVFPFPGTFAPSPENHSTLAARPASAVCKPHHATVVFRAPFD